MARAPESLDQSRAEMEKTMRHQYGQDVDASKDPRSSNGFKTRTKHLDGLRGLAALLVLLHHITPDMTNDDHEHGYGEGGHWHSTSLPIIRLIWSGGNAAIPIFLIISGYVLSIGQLRNSESGRRKHLLEAAVRRPVRLYAPALALSMLHGLMLHVPGLVVIDPNSTPYPQEDLIDELSLLIESLPFFNPFSVNGEGVHFPYNVAYWTLPVELRGSLLAYGLLFVLPVGIFRSNRALAILAGVLLLGGYMTLRVTASWTMVCFLWGLMLAIVDTRSAGKGDDEPMIPLSILPDNIARSPAEPAHPLRTDRPPFSTWICFIIGMYLLSEPGFAHHRFSQDTPGWRWLTAMTPTTFGDSDFHRYWPTLGSLCVIYAILRLRSIQRFFESRPLQFLGRISFSLYLVHFPCMRIFSDRFRSVVGYTNPTLAGTMWDHMLRLDISDAGPPGLSLRYLMVIAMTLPPVLLVAWLATVVIDQRSVRLSRALTRKLRLR